MKRWLKVGRLCAAGCADNENVYMYFPELNNYTVTFKKILFKDPNTSVRIHGISYPIKPELGASLEEYFNIKDFKINL